MGVATNAARAIEGPCDTAPPMSRVKQELDDLFDELDQLLKNPDAGAALADAGVNISLALTAADGLRAYLHGDKARAAEELGTAAEEIANRLQVGRALAGEKPS